ncbi:MAG: geranylgeranyl reductase family protein [Candidatus Hodarchaeales archaeon]
MKFDVAIVGAGTGGSATAIALEKSGLNVALIDFKKKENIGNKVCGDATSPSYFRRVRKMGVDLKDPVLGEGIAKKVWGFLFIPPRHEDMFVMDSDTEGWIIDRHAFGQQLVDAALDKGATMIDECKVINPMVEKDSLVGLEVRNKGKREEIRASVTVDASGVNAIIRKKLDPARTFMEKKIQDKDICYAYREIRELKTDLDYPDHLHLYFDPDKAPGGYFWLFPKEGHLVNAGLGVHLGQGTVPEIKKLYDKAIDSIPYFKDSKVITAGSWKVPLRRPIDTCVWNGLLLVGDAGSQVKPTDGGGIGISIEAGAFAGKNIIKAFDSGVFSKEQLWSYNVDIMNHIGSVNGPLELGKRKVISLSSKQIQEFFTSGIIEANDFYRLNAGEGLDFGKIEMLKKAWKGRRLLRFLVSLRKTMKDMEKAKNLYLNYPETFDEFIDWKKKIEQIYE